MAGETHHRSFLRVLAAIAARGLALISGFGAGAGVGTTGATNWVSLSFVDLWTSC